MTRNTRKGYIQAIANLSSWRPLVIQIVFLSTFAGFYYKNMYIFILILILLTSLFYNRLTAFISSILLSLSSALLIPILMSGIKMENLKEYYIYLFSTPLSKVTFLIIFIVTYYFNYSGSLVIREVLEPVIRSPLNFFNKKRKI